MRLKDKIAIITGAAQGIGLGVARLFAAEGAQVVLADWDDQHGRAAASQIREAVFIPCDVGDATQARQLVVQTANQFGRVDVCVNNAGIIRAADVLEVTEEDFDAVLRVNLKGAFLVAQAAAREMVKQGAGSIINMSSVNAVMAIPNQLPYNVSKGGLNQLTRVMAVALASRGVRVNAIGPGSIMTDMLKIVMNDEAARQTILSRTPMGRCGEVEEIARVALFLASDESSYLTGQVIYADGGRLPLNYVVPVQA
jgi:NAD(P)-dependent dehydrogenase (short-subunit alcohol dehydrogenase family)